MTCSRSIRDNNVLRRHSEIALTGPMARLVVELGALRGARRWVLHVPFIDRTWPQQTVQRDYITDATRRRISLGAQYLLDV